MTHFELDHVMVCISKPGDALASLRDFGLTLGHRGVQNGTGTSHAAFFFDNAYLELVWPEAGGAPYSDAPRLHFTDRVNDPAWSPFGISFRVPRDRNEPLPISTWSYHAPFLPPDAVPIPIGMNSDNRFEPLIIASLVSRRPDSRTPRPALQSDRGLREITRVRLGSPGPATPSPELQTVREFGWLTIQRETANALELEFDGAAAQRLHDFAPVLPLSFRW